MSDQFTASVCLVNCSDIIYASASAGIQIAKMRNKMREDAISYLMEPRRFFFFWKRQRTREQAERKLEKLSKDWQSDDMFHDYLDYGEQDLYRFQRLCRACDVCVETTMYLSIGDANLVKRYSIDDKEEK